MNHDLLMTEGDKLIEFIEHNYKKMQNDEKVNMPCVKRSAESVHDLYVQEQRKQINFIKTNERLAMDIKNFRYSQKKLIDSLKEKDKKKRPSTAQILKDKKVATDMKIEEQAEYENMQQTKDYNSAFDLNQAYLDTYNRKVSHSKSRLRTKNQSRSKSQKKVGTEENGKKIRPRSAYPLDQGTFGNQIQVVQRGLVKIESQKTGVESGQFVLSKKKKANRVQSAGPQRTTSYDSNPYGLKRERPQNRPQRIGKDNNYLLNEIDEFSGSGNDETQILY